MAHSKDMYERHIEKLNDIITSEKKKNTLEYYIDVLNS